MRDIWRRTIWAKGAIPPDEWKIRNLKRIALPVLDGLFILGGFSAARFGVPAISEFFDDVVVDLFSYALSLVAAACLAGVIFPRLWWLEAAAKSALLGLLTGYAVSLLILTAVGEGNRGFVLIIAGCAMVLPIWRLSLLASEWRERRARNRGRNG